MTTPVEEKVFESDAKTKLPLSFVLRRLHSLLGLWLCFYLFEHLLINSQAAWFFHDDGYGFVKAVNKIHAIPYLKAVELLLLGLPFLFHGIWGIEYLRTSKLNSFHTSGKTPSLSQFKRNRAYSWQRIFAWILLFGIIAHVVQMRFLEYPLVIYDGDVKHYLIRVNEDPALNSVAEKLHAKVYSGADLRQLRKEPWVTEAKSFRLKTNQVVVLAPNAGSAFFLIVRETMRDPWMVVLYSIFVIAGAYHAFNGVWTFMITWGITLTRRSQIRMRAITTTLMTVVMILGLMAIWGPYWTYLFQR